MKARFYFHKSTAVESHIADIDTPPRAGDFVDLPDIDSRGLYPVERVIFRLLRHPGSVTLEHPTGDAPQIEIYLGEVQDK